MSITTDTNTTDLIELAGIIGAEIAESTDRHDREGSFVTEGLERLRRAGALSLAVPRELGGWGASIAEVAAFQRALAYHCGSTALATAMHHHVVAFTAWRHRRGLPGAEATLRRVADEGLILVSTGGADYTHPRGEAVRVDGGYRVSGRKVFVSLSSVGDVMSTMFPVDDPTEGRRVINVAVPLAADGVHVIETWDALGMRGTASNEIAIEDVFVPDERVLANRPYGVVDPPLQVITGIAMPIIASVYLGVAEAAFDAAVVASTGTVDPLVRRQLGLMRHRLTVAAWALDGALTVVGEDPTPSMELYDAVMTAKREVALAGIEICDLAMAVVGGPGFFRGSTIERAYRDIRAASFHPLTPESTLLHLGERALGLEVEGGASS